MNAPGKSLKMDPYSLKMTIWAVSWNTMCAILPKGSYNMSTRPITVPSENNARTLWGVHLIYKSSRPDEKSLKEKVTGHQAWTRSYSLVI